MSTICWNCRGLGNPAIVQEVRELATKFTPAVLCLVETQIQSTRAEILAFSFGYNKSFAVSSSGRSGGLVLFWNEEIKLEVLGYSKHHIDAKISDLGPVPWRLTCIYGEAQVSERHKTWDTIRSLAVSSGDPWVMLGDFNEVLFHSEYEGVGQRSQTQLDGFRDALDVCGLTDLGHIGSQWTFEKRVPGGTYTRVRLDRAVADPNWCALFPAASVVHETAACSDHTPILLKFSDDLIKKGGPK